MLCNLRENSKPQCDEYWPKAQDLPLAFPRDSEEKELRVSLESETLLEKGLMERTFLIEKIDGVQVEKKKTKQIQVISLYNSIL